MVHDTLRGIKDIVLEEVFRIYTNKINAEISTETNVSRLALDGKTLKGSYDKLKDHKTLHLLSAFCIENQLILGHIPVGDKTNEIPCVEALIKQLGLKEGSIYTLDAMHCQKKHLKPSNKPKES